jgi:hypothetical protein
VTRLWFPLLIAALALCTLIAYARHERLAEAKADAEWAGGCAKIEDEVPRRPAR